MKRILSALLIAACLAFTTGCEAEEYDVPPPGSVTCGAYPQDAVVVGPCQYYRTVVYDGVPYQYYYVWTPGIGWGYHHYAWYGGHGWHGGGHGYYHGGGGYHGGGHGGGGHGGHGGGHR